MMRKTLRLSDGSTLGLIEAGEGLPLVFIHGVGLRAEAWAPQISDLQSKFHIFALDMPGHGQTDMLRNSAGLSDYVAWAAMVLRALHLGPVALAGHSMGALIAMGVAVAHPDLVDRLAILNGVYRRSDAAKAAVLARSDEIARGIIDPYAPLSRWFDIGDPIRDQVQDWLQSVDPLGYAAAYRAFAMGDCIYAAALPDIRAKSLVLTGEMDGNSTPDMAHAMAALIPRAQVSVIAKHRHMVNLTAPSAVTNALKYWLSEAEND